MRKRLLRTLLIALLILFALPVLLLGFLATESGTRSLLMALQPKLPIRIAEKDIQGSLLGDLQLNNLQIQAAPHQGNLKQLKLRWQPGALLGGELHIRELSLSGLDLQLGETTTQPEQRSNGDGLPELPFAVRLDQVVIERGQIRIGERIQPIRSIRLKAHIDNQSLHISEAELRDVGPLKQLSLSAEISPQPPHKASGQLQWLAHLPDLGEFRGQGQISGDLRQLIIRHRLDQPFALPIRARLSFQDGLHFDVEGQWQQLQWPLQGKVEYEATLGRFQLKGSPNAYEIDLRTQTQGAQIPKTQIQLQARGNTQGIQLSPLSLQTLGGEASLEGRIDWVQKIQWQLQLALKDIQPEQHWPELKGRLNLNLTAKGHLTDQGPETQLELQSLNGSLLGQGLSGQGRMQYGQQRLRIDDLALSAGQNQLHLRGDLAEQLNFRFQLKAPVLQQLWPGLAGTLKVQGEILGALDQPALQIEAVGKQLAFQQNRVGQLQAKIHWNPNNPDQSSTDLSLDSAQIAGVSIREISLKGPGNLARHQLKLKLNADLAKAGITLTGGYQNKGWQGELRQASLKNPQAGNWQLKAPVILSAGPTVVKLGQHCWQSQEGNLCLGGDWNPSTGLDISGTIKRLSLAIVQPFLPPGDRISGSLNSEFSANGPLDKLQANVQLSLKEMRYQPRLDQPMALAIRQLDLKGRLNRQRLETDLKTQLSVQGKGQGASWGTLSSQMALDLGRTPIGLGGQVKLDFPDIGPLLSVASALRQPRGRLSADLGLGGSLIKPSIQGKVRLSDGRFQVPDAGIQIQGLNLSAQGRETGLQINGQCRSGKGNLHIKGQVQINPSAGFPLNLNIQGERFQVARLPEAEVEISPNLQLQKSGNRISLTGRLLVPTAVIALKEIPTGSVAVSEDAVILSRQPKKKAKPSLPPTRIHTQLQVALGKLVHFKGFGLNTRISGNLRVNGSPGQILSGHGDLRLSEGTFKAYSQDLTIERGRFLFAGPLENPGLDIRAVRYAEDDVKAGVSVTGSAMDPRLKIFSVPAKPEAEALSYLLTGRGASAGAAGNASLRNAALAMGGNYASEITSKAGLDQLDFSGGAVSVGKQLSPDLYLNYVRDLFDHTAVIELKYKLSKYFDIKVSSGDNAQAADVLYHIER